MVLAAIGNLDGEPSLSEIASYLGMTHQNIKQLCLQLERKGYVTLDKNGQDRRIVRVVTTEKNKKEWDRFEEEDMAFIASLFSPFESEEYMRLDMLVEKLRTHLTMLVERADGP
jgi:DNA-binding MarR family transcriptional regulator